MNKPIGERINDIISDKSFNDLPFEQRKMMCKYLDQHQILTLWQAINNYPTLICASYRRKIIEWLKNCVADYEKNYSKPIDEP